MERRGSIPETRLRPATPLPCVGGLRALAAAAVVSHHCASASGAFRNPDFGTLYSRSSATVPLFLMISGFLAFRPYVAARIEQRPPPSTKHYLARRVVRILPLYWVATLVNVYVFRNFAIDDFRGFAEYMTLTWVFDEAYFVAPIQPAWTLAVLLIFYALVPVFARVLLGTDRSGGLAIVPRLPVWLSLLSLSSLFMVWVYRSDDQIQRNLRIDWLPTYLDIFALGMGLAVVSAAAGAGRLRLPSVLRSRHLPIAAWAAAGVLLLMVAFLFDLPGNRLLYAQNEYLVSHYFDTAIAFLLVLPAVFGPQDQGLLRRALASRPLAWLGALSFGVYLWHAPLIQEAYEHTGLRPVTGYLAQLFVVVLAASIGVAALSKRLVEDPLNRLVLAGLASSGGVPAQPAAERKRS